MKQANPIRQIVLLACAMLAPATARSQTAPPPAHNNRPLPQMDPANDLQPQLRKFIEVFSTVQGESADPLPVDKVLYEGAIPSMLRQLDPHTQFFDPGQFDQLKRMEESEQKGFGSIVSVLPGQVIFLQTFPGTPSNKAGIQAGDELLAINNFAIRSLDPDQITQLLTEARQQKISVYIRRRGEAKPLQMTLVPELVDASSVDRVFLLQPDIGYVRANSWDVKTAAELKAAIEKLGGARLQGMVIDLRNNPGGVVKAALDAAALFLQPGQLILTAKGRTSELQTADVPKNASPYRFPISVLINEKTASASEILAGALQDHDRAAIVGEPSFGKGLVQSVLPLSNGAGLAITTAFYYTPSGRSIQHPLRYSALSETFGSEPKTDRPTYKTDNGRMVYGGGGIQPDFQISPQLLTRLESVLDASGTLTEFATEYIGSHSPLPVPFAVTPEIIDEFKVFAAARGIQPGVSEWSAERDWISRRLEEEIITQARGVEQGDQIEVRNDPQVQAAIKALHSKWLVARSDGKH